MVGMLESFIVNICVLVSNILHTLWTILTSKPDDLAALGPSHRDFMEDLSPRKLAENQLKQRFLEALQTNNAQEVLEILQTSKLDIDVVLEVEDPSMVLASYKQGARKLCLYVCVCVLSINADHEISHTSPLLVSSPVS